MHAWQQLGRSALVFVPLACGCSLLIAVLQRHQDVNSHWSVMPAVCCTCPALENWASSPRAAAALAM